MEILHETTTPSTSNFFYRKNKEINDILLLEAFAVSFFSTFAKVELLISQIICGTEKAYLDARRLAKVDRE